MVVKFLVIPVDILSLESDCVFGSVSEVLGIEGGKPSEAFMNHDVVIINVN